MNHQRNNFINRYQLNKYLWIYTATLILLTSSCKKWIEVPPSSATLTSGNVFNTDAGAIGALTGIYAQMSANDQLKGASNITDISVMTGVSGDELTLFDKTNGLDLYYVNDLTAQGVTNGNWVAGYQNIYIVNAAIEGLNNTGSLTPAVKKQLLGEAYFMRGFLYFYLTNLYGDLSLALSSNYKTNAALARSAQTLVYQQIIIDLKQAENLLSDNFLNATFSGATTERVRPTKWAASALLAKAYLYSGDYPDAETESGKVIGNSALFSLLPLNEVFLANSSEAIWQLQPVGTGPQANTGDGAFFILPSTGPNTAGNFPVYLSRDQMNSFEAGDQRKANWTDSVSANGTTYNYAYKYKVGATSAPTSEYIMMFRLGEQYLIRAEAEARDNKIPEAQADLNVIRSRAGLPNTAAGNQAALLTAILQERRAELFTEWGNRWFDMQRFGVIDQVMGVVTPEKGGTWSPYKALLPVPYSEIQADPNLKQNMGY
jgi:hypothetical protein